MKNVMLGQNVATVTLFSDFFHWSTPPPEIILTNVQGGAGKAKRDVLRRSPVTIGHISWDEAMQWFLSSLPFNSSLAIHSLRTRLRDGGDFRT